MNNLAGKTLSLIVKHSALGASGGNYLVRYAADIELSSKTDIDVRIIGVYPNDPAPDDVEAAKNAIHKGCAQVLLPLSVGACVIVRDLAIHPVDFKPEQFLRWTAIELQRKLATLTENNG